MMSLIALSIFSFSITTVCALRSARALSISNFIHMLAVPVLGGSTIQFAGLESNLGNFFFSTVMYGLTLKALLFSFEEARECVVNILVALSIFFSLSFFADLVQPAPVFEVGTRIVAGAFTAFYTVQMLYLHFLEKVTKPLFSIIFLTIAAQILDSLIFFPIAFGGVMPIYDMIMFGISGVIIKSSLALASMPFLAYATRK